MKNPEEIWLMIVIDIGGQQRPGSKGTGKEKMSLAVASKSNANASMTTRLVKLSVVETPIAVKITNRRSTANRCWHGPGRLGLRRFLLTAGRRTRLKDKQSYLNDEIGQSDKPICGLTRLVSCERVSPLST